jgi:L,D-peptidoglycan transpeptidase YkuD (ErfK/YbiS/YcfS/YnhG family)
LNPRVKPGDFFKEQFERMRKTVRRVFVILSSAALIASIIFLLVKVAPHPPVEEVGLARETLAKAGTSKAGTYSKKLYNEARAAFDSAMVNWTRENRKFIYFRDFSKVSDYAKLSANKAKLAAESSISNSNGLKSKLKDKIDSLNQTEKLIDNLFGRFPLSPEIRSRISNGKMLLREAEVAYGKGQYLPANRKIADAEYLLTNVYDNSVEVLKNYFKLFPTWKKWVQSSISDSRKNNSYVVIVDKFSRKCYLYLGGIKKYEFDAELGRNWVGDKRRSGDKATPEGIYRISNKYQGRETPYYKALRIDYPRAEDREEFRTELAKGTIPASSRIGGGIEIHGGGGKGVDWTEGCVALTNSEIDLVYSLVKIGTTVTIVGSMKDIDDVLVN